jgi:ABC-2 type transport system ATP-binding protein
VLHRQNLGGLAQVTVGRLSDDERRLAATSGIDVTPVSLQQLVIRLSGAAESADSGTSGDSATSGGAKTEVLS